VEAGTSDGKRFRFPQVKLWSRKIGLDAFLLIVFLVSLNSRTRLGAGTGDFGCAIHARRSLGGCSYADRCLVVCGDWSRGFGGDLALALPFDLVAVARFAVAEVSMCW
jgi:hypothetical protein